MPAPTSFARPRGASLRPSASSLDHAGGTLSVVLPTYQEADAIGPHLVRLADALSGLDDWQVIVVDDDSPDGTAAAAARAGHKGGHDEQVRVLVRRGERGLATAVMHGFQASRSEWLVVMDSDGQHPPGLVPDMLKLAQGSHADIVIGSRYVPGGSAASFTPVRRFVSKAASLLAHVMVPPVRRHRVRDPMSGFFLVHRDLVAGRDLSPKGYKILLEILADAGRQGRPLRVLELPYRFGSRTAGESKLAGKTITDYVQQVTKLAIRDPDNRRLASFCGVGASGVLVNLGLLALAGTLLGATAGWSLVAAGIAARLVSVAWNFIWNDRLTFRSVQGRTRHRFLGRYLRFNAVSAVSAAVYLGLLVGLAAMGVQYLVAGAIAIAVSTGLNFGGNVHWTYATTPTRTEEPRS